MRTKSCFGFLFVLSIIFGIIIGMRAKAIITEKVGTTSEPPITPTSVTEPQPDDTILFIGVNHLDSDTPLLEGVWLATLCNKEDHPADTIHIKLVSLYPTDHISSLELDYLTEPHSPIPVNTTNLSKLGELPPLSLTPDEWDHVILVDEYSMNMIISLTNPNLSPPYPTPTPNTFIKSWENPSGANQQHDAILKTLCEEPETFSQRFTIQEVVKLNQTHLKTNLSDDGLYNLWQLVRFSPGKEVLCTFFP